MSPADFRVELHDQGDGRSRPRKGHRPPLRRRRATVRVRSRRRRPSPHRPPRARAAKRRPRRRAAKATKPASAAPAAKPTPRAGTKQAHPDRVLKRPEGATVEQIAAATGWQHHTIRGAISGALKKKLGLTVEATRIREVGPNKAGAKGSAPSTASSGSSPTDHRAPTPPRLVPGGDLFELPGRQTAEPSQGGPGAGRGGRSARPVRRRSCARIAAETTAAVPR